MGRGQYSFTFEFLHNLLRLPPDTRIESAQINLHRNVVTIFIQGDGLPETVEAIEPPHIELSYPAVEGDELLAKELEMIDLSDE